MSIVGRKGKLSLHGPEGIAHELVWQRIEDVLTADIFGAYRYLPTSLGLLPFLSRSSDAHGKSLIEWLTHRGVADSDLTYARIHFWPTLSDGTEPDLLVLLGSSTDDLHVALLCEMKLGSAQHAIMGSDGVERSQVGHYAIKHLRGEYADQLTQSHLPAIRPVLYVTAAPSIPLESVRQASGELESASDGADAQATDVFWCSWLRAAEEAQRIWEAHRESVQERPWLRLLLDINEDLANRDLTPRDPFYGVRAPLFSGTPPLYTRTIGVPHWSACLPAKAGYRHPLVIRCRHLPAAFHYRRHRWRFKPNTGPSPPILRCRSYIERGTPVVTRMPMYTSHGSEPIRRAGGLAAP